MRLPPLRKLVVPLLLGLGIAATLGREMVFAWALGTGEDLEDFRLAFGLPNTLAQTLGPAFIGVALPLLAAAALRGPAAYNALRARLLRFNLIAAATVTALGILAAAPLAALLAPGYASWQLERVVGALRVLWLFFLLAAASFHLRARLNQREVFWPGAASSLSISLAFIVGLPLAVAAGPLDAGGMAWIAVAGGALVLGLHLAAKPGTAPAELAAEDADPDDEAAPRLFLPMLAAATYQLSAAVPRFLDRAYATDLAQGSVAALEYSYNVITAPGILFGTSFVMLSYPTFVRAIAAGHLRRTTRRLGARFLGLAVAALLVGLLVHAGAATIVDLLYGRGAFQAAAGAATTEVLKPQALGLAPMVAAMVLAQGLLGLGALRLLLLLSAARILIRWSLLESMMPHAGLSGLGDAYFWTECGGLALAAILFAWRLRARLAAEPGTDGNPAA